MHRLVHVEDMGSCQNYGPLLGTLNTRCRTIIGTQKGTLILTTTHMAFGKVLLSKRILRYVVVRPYSHHVSWFYCLQLSLFSDVASRIENGSGNTCSKGPKQHNRVSQPTYR